jgi:nicotinate phosphoribosyltransferase
MKQSSTLLTDLYQLTMAYGYWKSGIDRREAVFHLLFRKNPFDSGYAIAGGLGPAIDFLRDFHFDDHDISYLRSLNLFDDGFLRYLRNLAFDCDVDAIAEGTVVFQQEPLVRVRGPLLQAQIVETALLNIINFQTLIATKAARIRLAAGGDPVLEFGLRRAQGNDGAVAASRAAYLGGCTATSNVLAGKQYGIPVRGTHAHSWVMAFNDEVAAFDAYARVMPDNALLLVDTYDTLQGVRNAVEVGKKLRESGHELLGVRLDSGDLAYLSVEARRILDEGGFPKAAIVASNELDEHIITSLRQQGAAINMWGVGTRLVTAYDQPALGGVYKLSAMQNDRGDLEYRVKLSEQSVKISTPGVLQVRRFESETGGFIGDMIFDELQSAADARTIVDPFDVTHRKTFPAEARAHNLLQPVFRRGRLVYEVPALEASRQRAIDELERLHPAIKRLLNPHVYPVGLEKALYDRRTELILEAKGMAA